MRKNIFKKALTLAVAGAMAVGMATTGFAANETQLQDNKANQFTNQQATATMPLTKAFVIENEATYAGEDIAYPAITYNYVLTADNTTDKYVQSNGTKVAVKPGKLAAVSGTAVTAGANADSKNIAIAFASGQKTLNAKGQEAVVKKTGITFTAENFEAPGIYRFRLAEATTNDTARVNAGIVKSTETSADHYIDVYVGWKVDNNGKVITDPKKELVINGYTLLSGTKTDPQSSPDSIIDNNGDGTPDTITPAEGGKESGLEEIPLVDPDDPTNPDDDPEDDILDISSLGDTGLATLSMSDMYYTYNVTLTKNVTGAMGDTEHEFPFDLTITNQDKTNTALNSNGNKYLVDGTTANSGSAAITANATKVYLHHEETATIVGLNPYAKVNYKETNDTASTYKVTVKGKDGNVTYGSTAGQGANEREAAKDFQLDAYESDQKIVADAYTCAAKVTDSEKTNATAITYTNDLGAISPTGVALRFAPYIIMIGAALALVAFSRRRRENA